MMVERPRKVPEVVIAELPDGRESSSRSTADRSGLRVMCHMGRHPQSCGQALKAASDLKADVLA
jgi:hypothetical protein